MVVSSPSSLRLLYARIIFFLSRVSRCNEYLINDGDDEVNYI